MSINDQEIRINAFATLGDHLLHPDEELIGYIRQANKKNAWFTEEQTTNAVKSVGKLLNRNDLSTWTGNYKFATSAKKIGLVLAGNIPMVGFHDILAVLISGNIALIKLSSNDDILIPRILERLTEIEPTFSSQIKLVERLEGFEAIIATGSNNTSRYFEYYFSKVPHIIRKNRNSIAILSGNETTEELKALGRDIFDYFGLGCRNVSKLFVPLG
ncbi:acyl-CoA reductase, partial [Pseudoxanthomonas sp. SGD-10]